MRRTGTQMLLKYEIFEPKTVGENTNTLKEKLKFFLRCFVLMTVLSFILLFYAPFYFQVTMVKRPFESSVYGWGLNTSRFLPLYILPDNDTALIVNDKLCSEPLPLLIIVCSAMNNTRERLAIRETWGNFSSPSFKLAFLVGTSENATLQEGIEEESRTYNDIIQEDFIDSYNNLTLKSVMLLKYIKNHCDNISYILKSDDDMFVHVENLISLVKKLIQKKSEYTLMGELICNAKPIHNPKNKWYTPRYMYQGHVYPHYLSGTGYLMDRKSAISLYEAALSTPFFHLEDVYITGLCATKAKIKPRHHSGFSYQTRPLDPCLYIKNKSIITSHRVSRENLRQLWVSLHNGTHCNVTTTSIPKLLKMMKISTYKKNRCI